MNIFDIDENPKVNIKEQKLKNELQNLPLAARMRPTTIDDVIGQEHILSKEISFFNANIS